MRASRHIHRQLLALTALLMLMSMPMWSQAQQPPRELTLNAVTINNTFLEVMTRHGAPHYVGPALQNADSVQTLLDASTSALGQVAVPGAPTAPGALRPGAPSMTAGAGVLGQLLPTRLREDYIVWMYEGNGHTPNSNAGFSTYVFFNKRGVVVGVVVNATKANAVADIATASGMTFGTSQLDIVKKYDWPDPFVVVGPDFYFSYPSYNVTFGLDQSTRKVVSIAIGLPFVVTASSEQKAATGAANATKNPTTPTSPYGPMGPYGPSGPMEPYGPMGPYVPMRP